MSTYDDGGAAFPYTTNDCWGTGLSLLDWFAAHCEGFGDDCSASWAARATGLEEPAQTASPAEWVEFWATATARLRYSKAAAMLAERARRREEASRG